MDYEPIVNNLAQQVFDALAPRITPEDMERVRKAYLLAKEAHAPQKRKSGEPYILHPIAVALMLKGLSPGAALVLLMVGPACNMASLIITGKVLGRRTLIIYIVSIILSALIFAYGIDHLLPREWFTSALSHAHAEHHHHAGIIPILSTIIMAGLLIHATIRKLF